MSIDLDSKDTLPNFDLKIEYGKYGGMYVPDPFSPALDGLADTVSALQANADFAALQIKALQAMPLKNQEITLDGKILNTEVYKTISLAKPFVISGYLALARQLNLIPSFAVDDKDDLKLFLSAASALDLKAYLAINQEVGRDANLVNKLKEQGMVVDVEKCATLFNDPSLYAFQNYISNISTSLFIPSATNVGPYPFPSLTSSFISGYAKLLKKLVSEKFLNLPDVILSSGYPGTSAVAVFKAFENSDVRIISVEKPVDSEIEECYCGMYARVIQTGSQEKILSPELILHWENGEVDRVFAKDFNSAIIAMDQSGIALIVEDF